MGELPASDHGTIDAVLGGEENMQSAAARDHFRPTFKAVKAKKDDEQATALKGVLNTSRVYVSSKGTARYKEYEAMVPNRLAMLKAEYDK